MYIDIYFDTICPWCLIGKKRLEEALNSRGHISLKLRWKPFLLNPNMPEEGMNRQTYLEQKFGGPIRAKRVYDVIAQTGSANGIDFRFDDISHTPNSIDSHRLISYSEKFDLENQLVEHLFDIFFMKGQNIGDKEVLANAAAHVGMNKDDVIAFLNGEEGSEEVLLSDREARELGVHGVPAFVARDRYVLSGAQEAKILGRFIDTAWNG